MTQKRLIRTLAEIRIDEDKGRQVIAMCVDGRSNREISATLNTPVTKINDFLLKEAAWDLIMKLVASKIESLGDIQARLNSGTNLKQIALLGGVSFRVLKLYCKKRNIKGPRRVSWEAGKEGVNNIIRELRAQGLSNAEIAERVNLKPHSVALRGRSYVPYERQDYWTSRGVPVDFHKRANAARTVYELKEHYRCSMANMRVLLAREGLEPPESPYWTRRPVDVQEVLALYASGMGLRQIKHQTGSTYADIKAAVEASGVSLLHSKSVGKKTFAFASEDARRNFGSKRMRHPIDISVTRFPNYNLLKKIIERGRGLPSYTSMDTGQFDSFVAHFYHDPAFCAVYCEHEKTGDKWTVPSIDHKTPYAEGGDDSLPNLQALTWFENYVKHNRRQNEWEEFIRKQSLMCNLMTQSVVLRHKHCQCQTQA